ncbi:MAG: stringent starvation protein B [Deltaproteobacteria bacterium]|nr:stringent starvation protein B [Deltaproteobacteria bacterium]
MAEGQIDYAQLLQAALRTLVRSALALAARPEGLPGEHHFFVTYKTQAPGVEIPAHLRAEHPEEMTIVIRSHYWDLAPTETGFSVELLFHDRRERLTIPYAAVSRFVDPSASFALQFEVEIPAAPGAVDDPSAEDEASSEEGARVVSLDAFRKK